MTQFLSSNDFTYIQTLGLRLENRASPPTNPGNGAAYYDTTANAPRFFVNGAWFQLDASGVKTGTLATRNATTPTAGAAWFTTDTEVFAIGNGSAWVEFIKAASQNFKEPVRAMTTVNHSLSGLAAIDGVTPVANDRVLVAQQTTASQNGVYVAASGAWTRAADLDTSAELHNAVVAVKEGTTGAGTTWVQQTANPVVGTSAITFASLGGRAPQMLVFTASSSFVKANYPGLVGVKVTIVAGGGGGGGAAATGATSASAGTGGSGGGFAQITLRAAALNTSETVTVGAAGTANSGAAGGNGGNSSFGSWATANGGTGGTTGGATSANSSASGPSGGTVTGGADLSITGGTGGGRFTAGSLGGASGAGGSNPLGNPGTGHSVWNGSGNLAGIAATGYGAGGGGANNSSGTQPAVAGGAGAPGVVLVELFF